MAEFPVYTVVDPVHIHPASSMVVVSNKNLVIGVAVIVGIIIGAILFMQYKKKHPCKSGSCGAGTIEDDQASGQEHTHTLTHSHDQRHTTAEASKDSSRKDKSQSKKEMAFGQKSHGPGGAKNFAQLSEVWTPTVTSASANEVPMEDGVHIVTTDAQFNDLIDRRKTQGIVTFSTDWCGFCKVLKPILHEAAKECKSVPFIYVDCKDISPEIQKKFGVKGYPHVVKINQSGHVDCNARSKEGLIRSALQ